MDTATSYKAQLQHTEASAGDLASCNGCAQGFCSSASSEIAAIISLVEELGQAPSTKPFYVTTPIFYVNAAPHVGHLYSMVLADVLKRWHTLAGRPAILCTGTDEHGMKVQRAADAQQMPAKEFCDEMALRFEHLAEKAQIDYDRFIRTTDADHVQAVEYFWIILKEKGFIYDKKHEGWYCVSDECFYPESMITKSMDPYTGEVMMVSVETGNKVEWIEEANYHFRMTALKDRLLEFYKENPEWVVPVKRMKEVVSWVENHLEDLSISRPVERLGWGIRVPGDSSQTIYVWVDALINYLTKAGFPGWTPGREHEGGWPADVHVIGKDITRFHCVYWPALLIALGLPLPKKVLSHAHWTMDHKKMSKSLGNVVNPIFAIDRWGVDAMRFSMIHDGGIQNDANYDNAMIAERYKKLLQSGIGNLASRVTKSATWSVSEAVRFARGNKWPATQDMNIRQELEQHVVMLQTLTPLVTGAMEELVKPPTALRQILRAVSDTNKLITMLKPWDTAKRSTKLTTNKEAASANNALLQESIYVLAESLRITGILLQPFMPGKAAQLLDHLGVAKEKRRLEHATLGADFEYGVPLIELGKENLFPPMVLKD
ncbi:hypothetical protein OQA88_4688 [Cercophora sp. LCS_1]